MQPLVSVLILGLLIFVHELGHFLFAKWNKVGVLEFAIGFGHKIFSKKIGETTYSLRLIPLGGYVKMVGDDPHDVFGGESAETAAEAAPEVDEETKRLMKDRSRWFLTKGYLPKLSIVLAGPGFNLLFAFIISAASFYAWGAAEHLDKPIIGDTITGYPAEKAGLKAKDKVLSIDGAPTTTWEALAETIAASGGKELNLKVERLNAEGAAERVDIKVAGSPDSSEMQVLSGTPKKPGAYKIGIMPSVQRKPVGAIDSIIGGAGHVWFVSKVTVRGLLGMVQGAISTKNIAGPIFIFKEAARSATKGLEAVLDFMIFLSVSLAILNLLPIPILDGGHILFFTAEAVKGSPISLRTMRWANNFGMAVLLVLMIFAMSNDILKLMN